MKEKEKSRKGVKDRGKEKQVGGAEGGLRERLRETKRTKTAQKGRRERGPGAKKDVTIFYKL